MKRLLIVGGIIAIAILGIAILKTSSGASLVLWEVSNEGTWLLPLVLVAALLDSVHPCSFSILLITIAFLFGIQLERKRILAIGGIYIAGIFTAYFAIGLGILKALHLFDTPHFMGKLGATILIAFGLINLINYLFPKFPVKLKLPSVAHGQMAKLMNKASIPAVFLLGALVGLCQFPCMGGPYLMVIGLLHDQTTYGVGLTYLIGYNLILILPLVAVLYYAADKLLIEKVTAWKRERLGSVRLWSGIAMIIIGLLILLV